MWACGWSEKTKRCLRFHCHSAAPCAGYSGDPKPPYRVGDYVADYTPVSTEELNQPTGAEELFANSKPVNRRE